MSVELRVLLIVISILTLGFIIKKIRQSKLEIEYAIFWIVFSFLLIILSIFPGIVYWLTDLLDISSPVNLVFLFIIFVLVLKEFMATIELSLLSRKIKELVQQIAISEREKEEQKKKDK